MMRWMLMLLAVIVAASVPGAYAEILGYSDNCTSAESVATVMYFEGNETPEYSTYIVNNCTDTEVLFVGANTSVLGPILEDEMIITESSVYVNSLLRPDLDVLSVLIFSAPYVFEPELLRDGVECGDCNTTFEEDALTLTAVVPGFSNYSLTGQQEFIVYSDPEPELHSRVYQTIDLGDGNRAEEFKCIVQLYGRNEDSQWVLVQTNPQRNVAAKLWGSPDSNNPESLGYFPTENGLANVYFDGASVEGYQQFEYVAQCASNSTKLVYEEPIDTRYTPAGRSLRGRSLWILEGENGFYSSLIVVGGFFVIIFALLFLRMWWRILRGY